MQSQHPFPEYSHQSHTWAKQTVIYDPSSLRVHLGDKEHLPNSLYLTQPLSIIEEETRPGANRTLGVVIGGDGVNEDSGESAGGDQRSLGVKLQAIGMCHSPSFRAQSIHSGTT